MEEILKGIKDLESFENKKQEWDLIKEIDVNSTNRIEGEIQDREKFENIKMRLINTIDETISRKDFNKKTNDPKVALDHLLALKGCLILMKFDNVGDSKEEMKKFKFSILKDIKYKTLGQEIEQKEYEDEVKELKDLNRKKILGDDDFFLDNEQQYQQKMPIVSKNKTNIFTKIKQFFKNAFGINNRVMEQNKTHEEELKFTKRAVAPLLETEIDNSEKEVEEIKINIDDSKKEFDRRIKVNGKYAEWKNGNVVIIDDAEKKEDEIENVIE